MQVHKLKYIEINHHESDKYYYFREAKNLPRFKLPDPEQVSPEEFFSRWMDAKAKTQDYKLQKFSNENSMKLSEALALYMKHISPVLCSNTIQQYKNFCTRLETHFGDVPIATITKEHLDDYLLSIEGASTANRILGFCQRAWHWFKFHSRVTEKPFDELEPREVKSRGHDPWTEDDVAKFKDYYALGTWPRLVLEVLLNTGCRISDALAMGHPNLYNGELHYVSIKSKVDVHLMLSPDFLKVIKHVEQDHKPFIYHPRTGKAFETYDQFYPMFKRACKKVNIDKTAHGLRKTVAIRYANQGYSGSEIKAVLGWEKLSSAEIYIKKANSRLLGLSASSAFNAIPQNTPKT